MRRFSLFLSLILGVASPAGAGVVTPPSWIKKPDTDAFARVWPSASYRKGQGGSATVTCKVTLQTTLVDCKVDKESPPGLGFGAAALMLTTEFLISPQKVDGVPVPGATVTIPINFELNGGHGEGAEVKVAAWAPWAEAPSAADVAAAVPERAKQHGAVGHVVLRCPVSKVGRLRGCETLSEDPGGLGFAAAARGLVPKFRAQLSDEDTTLLRSSELRVVLAVHFPKPSPEPAYVAQVDWVKLPDPQRAHQVFPERAVAAKIWRGQAVLDCTIGATGVLTNCGVTSQTPPGLGFGESAAIIAASMQANLWTRDGQPTPGAHVRLPLTIAHEDEAATSGVAPPDAARGGPPRSR